MESFRRIQVSCLKSDKDEIQKILEEKLDTISTIKTNTLDELLLRFYKSEPEKRHFGTFIKDIEKESVSSSSTCSQHSTEVEKLEDISLWFYFYFGGMQLLKYFYKKSFTATGRFSHACLPVVTTLQFRI